ncbi:MAG TPA: hypothetical protein PK198_21620, partial [Saprospiraceae bacterium]|nr:hypothetical protein [Saprospiraceae bacterium]
EVVNVSRLKWDAGGQSVTFDVPLPQKEEYYLLFNWWGVQQPFQSVKGIMLKASSGLVVKSNKN